MKVRSLVIATRLSVAETSHRTSEIVAPRSELRRKTEVVEKMEERTLTVAEIILIAGTRVALGAGIGLLLSNKLNKDQRNAAGLALAIFGGLTTIPLAISVIGRKTARSS